MLRMLRAEQQPLSASDRCYFGSLSRVLGVCMYKRGKVMVKEGKATSKSKGQAHPSQGGERADRRRLGSDWEHIGMVPCPWE
jgi:hypothetical protein